MQGHALLLLRCNYCIILEQGTTRNSTILSWDFKLSDIIKGIAAGHRNPERKRKGDREPYIMYLKDESYTCMQPSDTAICCGVKVSV